MRKPADDKIDPSFAPIEKAFAKDKLVTKKKMFRSSSVLAVNEKIFAMVTEGDLVVKLPERRVDDLVENKSGKRFKPRKTGEPMKEWIVIPSGKQPWLALAKEAYRFVKGQK